MARYWKCPECGKRRVRHWGKSFQRPTERYACDACDWVAFLLGYASDNDQEGLAALANANPEGVQQYDGGYHFQGALLLDYVPPA